MNSENLDEGYINKKDCNTFKALNKKFKLKN